MPELDLVSKGMTTCQGCAMELIARSALEVLGPKTITMTPPSCSAIITGNGDRDRLGHPLRADRSDEPARFCLRRVRGAEDPGQERRQRHGLRRRWRHV